MKDPTVHIEYIGSDPFGMPVYACYRTGGGEPGDGAWFWIEQDGAEDVGEPAGPFESAIEASKAARTAVVERTNQAQEAESLQDVGAKP